MTCTQSRRWLQAIWQSGAILVLSSILGLSINQLRPDRLALLADWSPQAQLASTPFGIDLIIPLEEAEVLFFSEQGVFVDARREESYTMGHIKGARNLPLEDFDSRVSEVMADVPPDTPIVTYCDGEHCGLSREVAFALIVKGFTNVRVLLNGWAVWQQANLPVE